MFEMDGIPYVSKARKIFKKRGKFINS